MALLGLTALGCSGGTEPMVPTAATVSPTTVSFTALGQTQQLAATVTDQDGNPITSPTLTWTTTNAAVATVSATGLASATGSGSAELTVMAGSASAVATVTVEQAPAQIQKVAGDGQTVTVGQALPVPLTVQVNDANGAPIAGATVTFSAPTAAGTLGTDSARTGADGRASSTFTVLASGAQQATAAVAGSTLTTSFTATGVSPFAIELRFLSDTTAAQSQAFTAAQQRWESLIVGDLSDVGLNAQAGDCGDNSPAIQRVVDDVLILVTLEDIDGPGGTLGAAGPCIIRLNNRLTVLGQMRFDVADLDALERAGMLPQVILHEMGHVLGFGTLWQDLGLLADPSLTGGTDPHFTGARAIAAFDAVGGADHMGGQKVPVEDTGGAGTADAHWRESVFGTELMTGFIHAGDNPLSRVTVASMADLGFIVNPAAADPFTLAPGLRTFGAGLAFELKNDVIRVPIRMVDDAGRVSRVVAP